MNDAPEPETADLPRRRPLSGSTRLLTVLKVVFTVVVFAAVLHSVDLASAWKYASEQNPWFLLLAAACVTVQIICGANRWHLILRRLGSSMPLLETSRIYYISVFFGACLLASVGGDVVRVWLAYRNSVGARTATISVVLDRVAGLAAVALFIIATSPRLIGIVGAQNKVPAVILTLLAVLGLLAVAVVGQLDRVPMGRWNRFRLVEQLAALSAATRNVYLHPSTTIPVLALAIAAQAGGSLAAYAIARSLGLDVTPTDCFVLMQPITLLATLPISIGGWGVREAAMVTFFGFVGVPSSAAVILSIQLGLLGIVVSLPGGLLFLAQQMKRPTKVPE